MPSATRTDLETALATALNDSTGSGSGSIGWTFNIRDSDLDFLSAGETLTATYDVTVFDGTTSSTQTVTITRTGAQDTAIVVNAVMASVLDTSATDDGQVVAAGNLLTGDSASDLANALSVTDVNGQPVAGSLDIAGAYGTLTVLSDGAHFYIANAGPRRRPARTKPDRAVQLHGQRQLRSQRGDHADIQHHGGQRGADHHGCSGICLA